MKLEIVKSHLPTKKYGAIFDDKGLKKVIPFGATGYSDYTINKDKRRRGAYLKRHRIKEDWTNPLTPGSLSRWILWGDSDNIEININEFKKKFNLT